nr:cytochrome o ubiquinol oxidase subunit IV [uncultured Desulfobacter sp.]
MDRNKINDALGLGHLSTAKYLVGFVLAVILTIVSFGLASFQGATSYALPGLFIAAIFQMLVHLHFFLHLDRSSKQHWNLITLAFSILLIFIFVGGSIWVMATLNSRMM